MNRRQACQLLVAAGTFGLPHGSGILQAAQPFRLNYSLASSMYGCLPLAEVLPEVRKVGADSIDLWPMKHGNQREQVDELGHSQFRRLLQENDVKLGMTTRYDLGPFKLADEIEFVHQLGGRMIVTGAPSCQTPATREQIEKFVRDLQPHVQLAEQKGVILAIENHSNSLLHTPDSLRYFAEFAQSSHLGIALAPYHLPQDPQLLKNLIVEIGPRLVHFYAWEHGDGCMTKLPKDQELKQLPGRGLLDFAPLIAGLKEIQYAGWTQVFMHPTPRGIPIMETATEVTTTINQSRQYLDDLANKSA
ncbi:sugar phosphate isomerase/epimerase family protein [Planctomicrobium sp. SH661]|uniref:sugar phosphate isomerase/epimerase family protein n=1 Tax=Planctomicrobium sp. SH661 TaxID=3448124 RepID=UPI003F5C7C5F